MSYRVSVIIPCYNAATYVAEAIESVLAQTLKAAEIIVINDGSTDNLEQAVAPYLRRHAITYIAQVKSGVAAARNRGIAAATGDVIAFLDADDRWLPTKLEKQLPLLSDAQVGLVYSDMQLFGNRTGRYGELLRGGYKRGGAITALIKENFVPTSSVLVRAETLKASGLFLENPIQLSIGEDYHLWLRIARIAKFDFVNEPLVEYRIHAGQTSSNRRATYRSAQYLFKLLAKDSGFAPYKALLQIRAGEMALKLLLTTLTGRG